MPKLAATISVGDIVQTSGRVVVITEIYIREAPVPLTMVKYVVVDLEAKLVSERTTDFEHFFEQEF